MARFRSIALVDNHESPEWDECNDEVDQELPVVEEASAALIDCPSLNRVNIIQYPYMDLYYHHYAIRLILNTGATTNYIRASLAQGLQLSISPASWVARQADGVSTLDVVGEVSISLSRGDHHFKLEALIVKQLEDDVLAGNPFLVANEIAVRPAKHQIVI